MAIRGRKPKSIAEKALAGNPGKRSLKTVVGAPQAGDMLCPRSVEGNGRAKAYWDMYLSNAAPGHLTPMDAPVVGAPQAGDMLCPRSVEGNGRAKAYWDMYLSNAAPG